MLNEYCYDLEWSSSTKIVIISNDDNQTCYIPGGDDSKGEVSDSSANGKMSRESQLT